jgi:hypothetical protein
MKVIGGRGATSRPIIKNRPVRAKICCELKEGIDIPGDSLGTMVDAGYGEVERKHRHGITQDQIFVPI